MKAEGPVINFHFKKPCTLRDRQRLKEFIRGIFKSYSRKVDSLDIIFCSDKYLLGINREYLEHDYFTDIVTFDLAERRSPAIGEMYISVDRVKDNAKDEAASFAAELHRVVFHGVLHLCRLRDKTEADQQRMRKAEDRLLRKYFGEEN